MVNRRLLSSVFCWAAIGIFNTLRIWRIQTEMKTFHFVSI